MQTATTQAKQPRKVNLGKMKKFTKAQLQAIIDGAPAKRKTYDDRYAKQVSVINDRKKRKFESLDLKVNEAKRLIKEIDAPKPAAKQ